MSASAGPLKGRGRAAGHGPVVLLHGLFRTRRSMGSAARWLRSQGLAVHNIGYPSTRAGLEELALGLAERLEEVVGDQPERVHFLVHSMGGILLRQLLALEAEDSIARSWRLGRVVMLATPNRGSRLADALGDRFWFRRLFGMAGQELRAGPQCRISDLPVPPRVALVAGTRSVGIYRFALRGQPERDRPNDGTVAVDEVRLGDAPLLDVAAGHTFIMNNREALAAAAAFFRQG